MDRRHFLLGAASLAVTLAPSRCAPIALSELRIGYQKTAILLVVKARELLEKRFAPKASTVKWVEFPFGPPLLEAVNAGAVDYGYTGDAPPIFAQAGARQHNYAAVIPARGYGQAIVVPADSPAKKLADLKGKKIGVAKGSSAHNLLVVGDGERRRSPGTKSRRSISRRPTPPPPSRAARSTPGRSGTRSSRSPN